MADNGLMYHYAGTSGLTELIYRGGKTQHLEGGVRVDAFARWPGVIEPGSAAGDIIHVTDLFTTFAHLAVRSKYSADIETPWKYGFHARQQHEFRTTFGASDEA